MYYEVSDRLRPLSNDETSLRGDLLGVLHYADAPTCVALQTVSPELLDQLRQVRFCKAERHAGKVLGTFSIPSHDGKLGYRTASFCIQKDSVILLDDSGFIKDLVAHIASDFVWHRPALGGFFCTLLLVLIVDDLPFLEELAQRLEALEEAFDEGPPPDFREELSPILKKLRVLNRYYAQMIDLAEGLYKSELLGGDDLPELRIFIDRCTRLQGEVAQLSGFAAQLRGDYRLLLAQRQDRTNRTITAALTLFLPLFALLMLPAAVWDAMYQAAAGVGALYFALWLLLCKRRKLF